MGLFKFIKDAGEKLFGATPAAAAQPDALQKEVAKHGLGGDGIQVTVDGDKVKVSGKAMSTADAEKIILALGNTQGVAEVESDLIVNNETAASNMYTVVKGDTLWAIAEKQYGKGKGSHYNEIFEANKPMLTHPDKIYPGQVLRIPPLA
ncbi:peptidoglycan-binding protein LysM [Alsobacter metallidurans]|uniref:Peptidoglycan-binding protein LysM n=1 Tax=Alsobacter metallidurans TaxID=340221 RepID=A0A917I9Q2_9HYPH|nr:peptidoglycan-binding protein LysM [Alsobacter metallidurans]GGH26743.1 peptidoglycan-binding protein LysM [Alsobacter metallidurans]